MYMLLFTNSPYQIFGRRRYEAGLRNLLSSLGDQVINRHVAFAVLDHVTAMFAEPLAKIPVSDPATPWHCIGLYSTNGSFST